MRYSALDHIGFTVSDLNQAAEFYTVLLGEKPFLRDVWDAPYVGRVLGYSPTKLDCAFWRLPGNGLLELIEYIEPRGERGCMEPCNVGNGHLCLVTEDLQADFERLRGLAAFRGPEPIPIPWGPYGGGWAAYITDPDGISIELLQLPTEAPLQAAAGFRDATDS